MDDSQSWPRCPEAAKFFDEQYHAFIAANPFVSKYAQTCLAHAGVDLRSLIDHWVLPEDPALVSFLRQSGLMTREYDSDMVWEHPAARLPSVRFSASLSFPKLAIGVEDVDCFLQTHDLIPKQRLGEPDSQYEEAYCSLPKGEMVVVARRGYGGFQPGQIDTHIIKSLAEVRERLRMRPRSPDDKQSLAQAESIAKEIIAEVGLGRACDEFFAAEREYFMSRNSAARRQYELQQNLGIGWANHDHHTYRSSRESFRQLMQLWLTLGFEPRERLYAGAEAGWGAQVLEHPMSRVVIFSDVDMAPEEVDIDYTVTDLAPRHALGTIGLWCALHGSSIGTAGMHHLEAEFDFAATRELLIAAGISVMRPFTDLPMLKQAFTQPEIWQVPPERIDTLLANKFITESQAGKFTSDGAAGSHLEILQRWEGFKGFNKTGISHIILETDARRAPS